MSDVSEGSIGREAERRRGLALQARLPRPAFGRDHRRERPADKVAQGADLVSGWGWVGVVMLALFVPIGWLAKARRRKAAR